MTKSVTLRPGNIVSIPGVGERPITKIDQDRYDRFRIGLDEHDPSVVLGIDTRGYNRVPEQPLPATIDSLTIELFDLVSIPGVGTKTIGVIHEIRTDRYQLRLEEKYEPSVVVDIVTGR